MFAKLANYSKLLVKDKLKSNKNYHRIADRGWLPYEVTINKKPNLKVSMSSKFKIGLNYRSPVAFKNFIKASKRNKRVEKIINSQGNIDFLRCLYIYNFQNQIKTQ